MVSFEVEGGLPEARRVARRLSIFKIAESLGGVESLVELRPHPFVGWHRRD
jgi:cystathionine beta-lyase/cystathionine gamma-synthase